MGAGVAVLWTMLLLTGVPEVDEGRVDIWFHVAAELVLAALLVAGGVAVLRRMHGSRLVAGVALGALVYSVINGAGYYAQDGEWLWVGIFATLLVATGSGLARLRRTGQPTESIPSPARAGAVPERVPQ